MARKKQDSLKAIATQVVKPKESQATPAKKRVGRQYVNTPVGKDVILRAEELTHGGRLTKAAFAQLKKDFPTQGSQEELHHKAAQNILRRES